MQESVKKDNNIVLLTIFFSLHAYIYIYEWYCVVDERNSKRVKELSKSIYICM